MKRQLLIGTSAFCWAIWLSRNDVMFDKTPIKSFMQILYREMYWLHFWSQLQSDDQDKEKITKACQKLEVVAMQIFFDHAWKWSNRICA
jgi:hypothetical protein